MMGLIGSNDLHMTAHPVWRQIDASAVPAASDQFFDHLLSVYFEFYFRGRMVRYRYPGLVFLVVSHVECLPHIFSNLTAQALYSAVMVMLSKAALVSQLAHASRK